MRNHTDMSGLELFGTPFGTSERSKGNRGKTKNVATADKEVSQTPSPLPELPVSAMEKAPIQKEPAVSEPKETQALKESCMEKPAPSEERKAKENQELTLHLSPDSSDAQTAEARKRNAHEEAEAKRKAAWEERKEAKRQAEEAALQKVNAMGKEETIEAAIARVRTDMERLTRRNMKECMASHIQEVCRNDSAFARCTMHPKKSMANCFRYINRMAKEYGRREMEENGIRPDGDGYGFDVPDGLCYQWAEEYFHAEDAPEDREKEEPFVPRPYVGATSKTAKQKKEKPKKEKPKKENSACDGYEQMTLEGVMA